MITVICLLLHFKNIFEKQIYFFLCFKLFFYILNYFNVLILKINLKIKKYYFNIFLNKNHFKKNYIGNSHRIEFILNE
jgi:hypothetical protein